MYTTNNEFREALAAVQAVCETTQELSHVPIVLNQNDKNADAYVQSLRLAAFDHPSAFAFNGQNLPMQAAHEHFNTSGSKTFAVGEGRRMLGAISLTPRLEPDFSYFDMYGDPSLDMLFVLKEDQATQGLGKRLLHRAVEEVVEQNQQGVQTEIISTNSKGLKLAKKLGFKAGGAERLFVDRSLTVVSFALFGRDKLIDLQKNLQEQNNEE